MSSPFAKPSEFQGGAYFKPAEHMNDLALLVEPKSIRRDVESTYQNVTRRRDEVTADVTIFANTEALDKGVPSEIQKGVVFTHGMLTGTLERILPSGATVAIIRKVPTKSGSGYAFRDVEASVEAAVANYYTKRESAVAEALNNVPSFE